MSLGVGSSLWIYSDRWRYSRNGPPEIERYDMHTISGETKLSWLVALNVWDTLKVSKKDLTFALGEGRRGQAYSDYEALHKKVTEQSYVNKHRYTISSHVQSLGYDLLKQVADLIGYKEDKK